MKHDNIYYSKYWAQQLFYSLIAKNKQNKKEQNMNKDTENKPYFANAQEKDEVFCIIYGKGTINNICKDKSIKYPIAVQFKHTLEHYTVEGKISPSAQQTLYYADTIVVICEGQEPVRKYTPQAGDVVNLPKKEVGIVQNVFEHPINGKTTLALIVQLKHSFHKEKTQMCYTLFNQCEYLENVSLIKRYNTVKEAFNSKEFNYNQ